MKYQNFQDFLFGLTTFWTDLGCFWSQPYDSPMGAGTFHPNTFLKGLGSEPWRVVYVQPCRRPVDGRYGKSTYRFQHYYQLQVFLKPAPADIVDVYLASLQHVGINLKNHDLVLLEDDWKGPTLGAWGLGWEARANGQEISQFTYFQQLGGLDVEVVSGEITYGTERLFMYANGIKNGLEIPFTDKLTYGDVFFQNEFEFSHFNFTEASIPELLSRFSECESNVAALCEKKLILPAYDFVLQGSHCFNLLDARGAISATERQRYIGRVRETARKCALGYLESRKSAQNPLHDRFTSDPRIPMIQRDLQAKPQEVATPDNQTKQEPNTTHVLIELGVEEMPPSFQWASQTALAEAFALWKQAQCKTWSENLEFQSQISSMSMELFVSARRIAFQWAGIPETEPDRTTDIMGPAIGIAKMADGNLSPAGLGFCRKNQLNPETIGTKKTNLGEFLFASKLVPGKPLSQLLAAFVKSAVYGLKAPLMMRWLHDTPPFIRPVRWILALENKTTIPLDMFGLQSSNVTYGQRILTPQRASITASSDYELRMTALGVMPRLQNRFDTILATANKLAAELPHGKIVFDEQLIQKCAGLSESPYVYLGEFDSKYLELPKTLIVNVLKEHMNCIAVENTHTGKLLNHYIGVGGYTCGNPSEMIAGTRQVVEGRLEDGAFYYYSDIQKDIGFFYDKLDSLIFQEGMGTLKDKSDRMVQICENFFKETNRLDSRGQDTVTEPIVTETGIYEAVRLACKFAKADLKTGTVMEFPDEMQGIMGGLLIAKNDADRFGNLAGAVAQGVSQHYFPVSASSPLPDNLIGCYVSLIDKLDSLATMTVCGTEFKSSKDPLGTRRLAIGILRLLGMDNEYAINLSLDTIVNCAMSAIQQSSIECDRSAVGAEKSFESLYGFLLERLNASWSAKYHATATEAVLAKRSSKRDSLVKLRSKISAASDKMHDGTLVAALEPYKRCKNMFKDETTPNIMRDSHMPTLLSDWDPDLEALWQYATHDDHLFRQRYENIRAALVEFDANENYPAYFATLASLGDPLEEYSRNVRMNHENSDIKKMRRLIFNGVCQAFESIADFSRVVG